MPDGQMQRIGVDYLTTMWSEQVVVELGRVEHLRSCSMEVQ